MSNATLEVFSDVREYAERIKNDESHVVETCSPGDMWVQGDIGIMCLDGLPLDAEVDPKPQSQLAPGTTQGSRHCIVDLSAVTIYRLKSPSPLDGPIIEAPRGFTVEHPEHGDVTMPAGVYAIVYQRAFAQELRRVQD